MAEVVEAKRADRRRDTHEKIKLGGLVAKAGLANEDATVLLGALLIIKDMVAKDEFRSRALIVGSKAMGEKLV